ncbi:MAG: PD-(D/E)XK nuclease family protein [Actinomycetota bacterium]
MQDAQSKQIISHRSGLMLVLGAPGSGKTRMLLDRYANLVEHGVRSDRILLLVSRGSVARKLRDDLVLRLARSLPGVNVLTAREFARAMLEANFSALGYSKPPEVLNATAQESFVRRLLEAEDPSMWPSCSGLLRVNGFVAQVARFVLRLHEAEPDEAVKLADGRLYLEDAARFYGRYLDALARENKLDSSLLVSRATDLVQRGIGERIDHVLIDDYHDSLQSMNRLRAALAVHAQSTVIALDPFDASDVVGELEPVASVALDAPTNTKETLQALESPVATPASTTPANIAARLFAHPGEEADAIAHELVRAHVQDHVPWSEMAVIVRRYGSAIPPIRHALERHRVPFVAGSSDLRLIEEPAVEPLCTMLAFVGGLGASRLGPQFVDRYEERDSLLDRVLCSAIVGLAPSDVRALRRRARISQTPALEMALRECSALNTIVELLTPLVDDGVEAFWTLYERCSYIADLVDRQSHRDLDALVALTNALDFEDPISISELLDAVGKLEAPSVIDRYPDAVKLLSVHDARGRFFELVIVANCIEGEFPSSRPPSSLIDANEILDPRSAIDRVKRSFLSERALFRCAMTRSRSKTLVFASRSASASSPRTPSRFIEQRLGLRWETVDVQESMSKRGAQAELRRIARDSASSKAHRLAALEALRRSGEDPTEWWGANEWSDPGAAILAPDETLRTSYTRISQMADCGLRYLYQVELGLDPDQSYQMWVGSTVHEIIDRAQRGEVDLSEQALHAELDALWDPGQFPNRAIEHRRYLDCKRMLVSWLREESATPVVASEAEFEYPIEGAIVRGKIDAIKRMNNGKLRIIDYKTGMYPPSRNDVKSDLQLASYYLATRKCDELAALGEPGALQLAYIAKPSSEAEITLLGVAPPEVEPWAEQRLIELTQSVREERFAPSPDADCTFCSFRQLCPMWPEGMDAST